MKTRAISGWSTRLHAAGMTALCVLALALAMPTAKAQEATAAPTATEAPADAAQATTDATTTDAAPVEAAAAEAEPAEAAPAEAEAPAPSISKADTVWVLVSAALVIFMTLPGLALFYGGLVRSKNVLSILVQNLAVFSLVAKVTDDDRVLKSGRRRSRAMPPRMMTSSLGSATKLKRGSQNL